MDLTVGNIILVGSILLFLSVIVGKTSYKFGVPTLILFLSLGMLAGSEGFGGINFEDPELAQFVGIVALNFILFSGGLDTNWKSIKPVLGEGITLSTVGVLLTAVTVGVFIWSLTSFTIYESLLLGSIVSSTDAAAVFSILRGKNLALRTNLRPTLELESGSNDPMAYVLTIAFLALVVNQDLSLWSLVPLFFQQMIIGGIGGFVFGRISKSIINRISLDFEGLYSVLVISLMFITFSVTDFFGGNGFLAIYIAAVYLGNQELIHKNSIIKMFDGLAWLMQIVLFLTLGLLVFPTQILPIVGIGLLISLFLMFVARPLAVFISLLPFKMMARRRIYISWVGLRGAVPIVFATYPLMAGIENADMMFHIVFFISVTSVLLQGTTLSIVAHWLNVALPDEEAGGAFPASLFFPDKVKSAMKEIPVAEGDYAAGKQVVELGLPQSSIIAMIKRNGNYLTPRGATTVEPNDVLIVISDTQEVIGEVEKVLQLENPQPQ